MGAVMTTEQIYFNPWDEAYRANPYPYYKPLYRRPPYLLNLFFPMALVGRYQDAIKILRDHERFSSVPPMSPFLRSEEHTSELQSHHDLVCRLLLEKKK